MIRYRIRLPPNAEYQRNNDLTNSRSAELTDGPCAPFSEPAYRDTAREILAKAIIQAAKKGEYNQRKLSDGALLQLSKANLRRSRGNQH